MFSGIKYIFGYTEETVASPTVNDVVTAPTVPVENTDVPAASADTSTTNLEQTLNSATTKFAEQLLPQQASIEQLQSSSHQLLPSIIEQHEEDELKKKSPTCENAQIGGVGDDDDEDGFNAESWELLDLVEKVAEDEVAPVGLSSSVQKDGSLAQGISKSTSGILKTQNTNDNGTLQARQKPKVSFEAPDLVKFKQGIEQTKSNVAAATAASGSGNASKGAEDFKKVSVVAVKDDVCGQNVPILNYAKALSSKIRADAAVNPSGKTTEPLAASPSKLADEEASNLNGPVKRVRPTRVSTSSWSSHDDDEEDDIEQVQNADWESFYEKPEKKQPLVSAAQIVDADDNESVISSGFSDCDYGFGGNNDYVMRPKKANVKRGRSSSSKLGSTSGTKASRSERKVAKGKLGAGVEANSEVPSKSTDAKDHKSETPSSSRNSKPKKKRMIMSTNNKSVNLSDFLKSRPGSGRGSAGSSTSKEVGHQVSLKKNNSSSKQLAQKEPTLSSSGVGGGSGGGSTESSDVADMDESWFVTPPSCFTGAARTTVASGKVGGLPKSKEADRENALIEHPSIYIANTASRSPVKAQGAPTAKPKLAGVSSVEVVTSKPNNSASKILEKLEDESWNSGDDDDDDDDDDVNFDDDQLMPTSKLAEVAEKTGASGSHGVVSIITSTTTTASGVAKPSDEMKTADSTTAVSSEVKNKEDGKRVAKAKSKQKSAKMVIQPKRNLEKQKARASGPSSTATMKPSENKAWKNKFIVDAWDLDENDDADSDFDNMFESSKKRKSPMKTKKQQQQQQKQVKLKKVTDEDNMSSLGSNEIASYENDASSSSVELLSVNSLESQEFENNENLGSIANSQEQQTPARTKQSTAQPSALKSNAGAGENRRPPTQVRPIEPERVPSWLLKRQRSRRRPLGTASVLNKQQPQSPKSAGAGVSSFKASSSKTKDESLASGSSSSRSTPTLIDRIGCSIVANLTNLTSGLVSSGAMNYCPSNGRSAMIESQEKTVAAKSSLNNYAGGDYVARKQLSRGSIRRQNICSKQGNSLRRPDRRLKLFATPNGCSINRKVHTSIH